MNLLRVLTKFIFIVKLGNVPVVEGEKQTPVCVVNNRLVLFLLKVGHTMLESTVS